MAGLTDLPLEIVDLILRNSKESLATLTRVYKSMHRFSQPLLYEEILIKEDHGDEAYVRIDLLLRTILERPALARLIKRIQFRTCGSRWRPMEYQLSRATIHLARSRIRQDGFPYPDMWIEEMEKGVGSVAVTVLLSQLHKLESLEMGGSFQSHLLGLMFKHVLSYAELTTTMSTFGNLKEINLNPGSASPRAGILKLDEVKSLFGLPSMQSLSFLAIDVDKLVQGGPCNQNLTSLSLHNSQIREESLTQMLAMVPNLKSLSCCLWCDPEPIVYDIHSPFLDCEILGKALEHTRLIEHLAISIKFFTSSALEVDWGGAYEEGEEWGIRGNIGSLTHMKHLKSLEIPIVVLLGWVVSEFTSKLADVLPRNLDHLLLRNDLNYFQKYEWNQEACLGVLSEYMGTLEPRSASLGKITVKLKDCAPEERWDQDAYDKMNLICREAKVLCSFDPPKVDPYR